MFHREVPIVALIVIAMAAVVLFSFGRDATESGMSVDVDVVPNLEEPEQSGRADGNGLAEIGPLEEWTMFEDPDGYYRLQYPSSMLVVDRNDERLKLLPLLDRRPYERAPQLSVLLLPNPSRSTDMRAFAEALFYSQPKSPRPVWRRLASRRGWGPGH